MKKNIFLFITLVIITLFSYSDANADERVAGHWEGKINIPIQPLHIKVDLSIKETTWNGTIDIPAQNAKGLILSNIHVKDNEQRLTVKFGISGIPGNPTFDGLLHDGVIKGRFTQGGATFDFELSRATISEPIRPQEPKPPYPYKIEEVSFNNGVVNLSGTLTIPSGNGPFPAAVLISGSGLQDRDQTIFGHKPFWVLADHLTRAGIVVLRVDDPGIGKSTPHPKPPTTADFATDVEAAVAFLLEDNRINSIGLIGHSEGGGIASIVASRSDDISFIVLMAGPGVRGAELLRKQNERIFEAMKMEKERKQTLLTLLDQLFTLMTSEMEEEELRQQVTEIVRKQFEANGVPADKVDQAMLKASTEQVLNPWMRYFLTFDPQPYLTKVKVPVLVINGELDVQVDAEQNLTGITIALKEGGNQNVTVHRLPKLNHLFQTAKTGLVNEYATIEETVAPEVLNIIRDWVIAITNQ